MSVSVRLPATGLSNKIMKLKQETWKQRCPDYVKVTSQKKWGLKALNKFLPSCKFGLTEVKHSRHDFFKAYMQMDIGLLWFTYPAWCKNASGNMATRDWALSACILVFMDARAATFWDLGDSNLERSLLKAMFERFMCIKSVMYCDIARASCL